MLAHAVCAANPCGGSSFATRWPSVLMIRQPPAYVPAAIAAAALTITQTGGRPKSALRWPEATRARAMMPIVFWASFVPWVKATKPPEMICRRLNTRFTIPGDRRRMIQMTASMISAAPAIPLATVAATLNETNAPAKLRTAEVSTASRGESARVDTLVAIELAVSWKPFVKSKKSATATTATSVRSTAQYVIGDGGPFGDPLGRRPDLAGRLRRRVGGRDAPVRRRRGRNGLDSRPGRRLRRPATGRFGLHLRDRGKSAHPPLGSHARAVPGRAGQVRERRRQAPAARAGRGLRRRLERRSPLQQPQRDRRRPNRERRDRRSRAERPRRPARLGEADRPRGRRRALGVFHDDIADQVGGGLAGVDRVLEALEDVLPANDDKRVDAGIAKEIGDRVAENAVTVVLERLQRDELLLHATPRLQVRERRRKMLDRGDQDPTLLDRLLGCRFDAVEFEEVGGLVDVVDDVVDRGRELVDVLAVERGHLLRVQEVDDVVRDAVARVLDLVDVRLRDRRVRVLAEANLGLLRRVEGVRSRLCEQVVKLCGPRDER